MHCLPCMRNRGQRHYRTQCGVFEVIFIRSYSIMHEQQTSKNARLVGYALGAIVAAIAVAWKFFVR